LKSLGATWLVSGLVFCAFIRGPGTVSAWIIWGSLIFIVGWLVVGLPLIALGDRIFRVPFALVVCAGGLVAALLMLSPNLVVRFVGPQSHWVPFAIQDLAWPSVAFGVAAFATALYCFLSRGTRVL
jgi:hypothetical protein